METMTLYKKPYIIYQPEATPEYPYNVQVYVSINKNNGFMYCGLGRFCKTLDDAIEYATKEGNVGYYIM